jgi:hypothetical protein
MIIHMCQTEHLVLKENAHFIYNGQNASGVSSCEPIRYFRYYGINAMCDAPLEFIFYT